MIITVYYCKLVRAIPTFGLFMWLLKLLMESARWDAMAISSSIWRDKEYVSIYVVNK